MAVITGLGLYLPSGRISAGEIAVASGLPEWVVTDKLGIESKPVPGPDDHPAEMAVRASRDALSAAGVDPGDVDVVLSMTEEHKEYPVWTAGPYIAEAVGAGGAWAFDANQKCGSFILALSLARALLRDQPGIRHVLIAGGYRNGDLIDFADEDVRFMYDLGAGAGAAVVSREGDGLEVLSTRFITDGKLARAVLVPVGGTKRPLTGSNYHEYRLRVVDRGLMKSRLEEVSLANFLAVIRGALEDARKTVDEVGYVALLHMKRSAHEAVLASLGLAPERSIYLSRYGHLGQVDQILSLDLAVKEGRLHRGQLAVLAAAGVGYVWNAAVVQWT